MQNKNLNELTPKERMMIQEALALHQSGQLDAAETQYRKLLNHLPSNTMLLTNLGTIALQKGNSEDSIKIIKRSVQINPNQPYALYNLGNALQDLKRHDEALLSYDHAIKLKPDFVEVYYNRALVLEDLKRLDEALSSYDHAIALKPEYPKAFSNRGNILSELNRLDEALSSYDRAITLKSDNPETYCNRGVILKNLKRWDDAIQSFDRAIELYPDYAEAFSNRGNALQKLNRPDEALISFDRAIYLCPDFFEAYSNRGISLQDLRRDDEALVNFDRAITIKSDFAEAYSNRGISLQNLKRYDEALESYDLARTIKPDFFEAYSNRGHALQDLNRLEEALESYELACTIKSDMDFILSCCLHTKMHLCIWDELPKYLIELTHKINNNEKVAAPLVVLALIDDPEIQKKTAEIYVLEKYPFNKILPKITRYLKHSKIRIGYFSVDFRIHAVSYLTAELYETHDRNQFEIHAFSYGSDTKDEMNLRIKAGVDHFHDVRMLSDKEVAVLARHLEIDIAVDLGGFTTNSRTGIFAMQVAPIQISYIGYLGTMGAHYYDYLVADQTIIPDKYQSHYSEKIAYLPSYQVNDSKQSLPTRVFTRQDLGLPETGFVFCCFNNTYKITPTTFDGWARILKHVEGSVLLIYADNESVRTNLTKEVILRGIDPKRLIFGKRLPMLDYLARYRVADLFLDTLPYNAGTTASDALRMGLPVLTLIGHSFASRVAASILNAVNLPEMITTSQEQYESLAIEFGTHPEKLTQIKNKLLHNLSISPLYDIKLFTQHIESAYLIMQERQQNGLPPDHIYVENKI